MLVEMHHLPPRRLNVLNFGKLPASLSAGQVSGAGGEDYTFSYKYLCVCCVCAVLRNRSGVTRSRDGCSDLTVTVTQGLMVCQWPMWMRHTILSERGSSREHPRHSE